MIQPSESSSADAHDHREREADLAGLVLLLGRQLAGEDRDEDDVVDAEHDLEGGQREEADPGLRVGEPVHEVGSLRGWRTGKRER